MTEESLTVVVYDVFTSAHTTSGFLEVKKIWKFTRHNTPLFKMKEVNCTMFKEMNSIITRQTKNTML